MWWPNSGCVCKQNRHFNTLMPKQNGRHFADAILDSFSWMKMCEFRLKFHWSLFLRVRLTIFQHWFRYWLEAGQATNRYLKQVWLDYRRIYAPFDLNELTTIEWYTTNYEYVFRRSIFTWEKKSVYNGEEICFDRQGFKSRGFVTVIVTNGLVCMMS